MRTVAVIWSSPNVDGLTASAKEQYIKGLTNAGAKVEEIHLNKRNLEHCKACGNGWGTCNKTGACVIKDDFADIYKTLSEADGIVWISAVYWSDMTECMKAFFDRLRRCDATVNHFLSEKRCILVACAGGTGRGTLECLTQLGDEVEEDDRRDHRDGDVQELPRPAAAIDGRRFIQVRRHTLERGKEDNHCRAELPHAQQADDKQRVVRAAQPVDRMDICHGFFIGHIGTSLSFKLP